MHASFEKNMDKAWREINLGFRELGPTNILLKRQLSYKCLGNVPYSYILPHPFDGQKEDNYLMDTL